MALDSNAQIGCSGSPLSPFIPFPTLGSHRVNVFAQDVASQENAYVFLPGKARQGLVLIHHCGSKTVSSPILVASYSSKGISFPGPHFVVLCLPVSSVGKAPDCCAGGRRFKPRPDQHSGSLNN